MSAFPGSAEGTAVTGLDSTQVDASPETLTALPPLTESTRAEAREIIARYPRPRSALLPMLHLVQSVQGYVSPQGVALCAEELGLTKAEVGAVATFYTMYKRQPTGRHLVSVCTNTLCSVLGGQAIFDALAADVGVGHNRTAADGSLTLEHAECLAACDYAPVVTVDYEFYDQQNIESARELVAELRRGEKPVPTRGAPLTDFRGVSRQLAGFSQHADAAAARAAVEGPSAGVPTLIGVRLAAERGETAPPIPPGSRPRPDTDAPRATIRPTIPPATRPTGRTGETPVTGRTGETPQKEAADAAVAAADTPAERAGAAADHPDAPQPAGRRTRDGATAPRSRGTRRPGKSSKAGQSGQGGSIPPSTTPPTAIEGEL